MTTEITRIVLRRGTAAAWTAANPVLLSGESGLETDTKRTKMGDGATIWAALPYDLDTASANATYAAAFLPEKYGALGDGVPDDGAALLAASTAAAVFGGTLWLSAGKNYKVTSSLVLAGGVKIAGTGRIFGAIAGNPVVTVGGTRTTIKDITIENTDATVGNIGINVRAGTKDLTIKAVKFLGVKTQAVNVNALGVSGVLVTGCTFDGVAYGFLSDQVSTDLRDVRIIGNRFVNIIDDAIELNSPIKGMGYTRTPRVDAQSGFVISGNYISNPAGTDINSGFGVGVAGACDVTITGNVIVGARRNAIHVEDYANNITISGNTVIGGATGIYLMSHANGMTITANTIANTTANGIDSAASPGEMAHNYTISGNTITAAGGDGLRIVGVPTDVDMNATAAGNHVRGCVGDGIFVDPAKQSGLTLTGNTTTGNTGAGIRIGQGFGSQIGRNISYGNAGGNYLRSGVTPARMSAIGGRAAVSALAAATTAWAPLFTLGQRLNGTVTVTANLAVGADWQSVIFTLAWDGTTLTATQVQTASSAGSMAGLTVRANAGNLEVNTYWAGGATTVNFEAAFEGQLLL